MAEGARLLSEYGVNNSIESSNLSFSAIAKRFKARHIKICRAFFRLFWIFQINGQVNGGNWIRLPKGSGLQNFFKDYLGDHVGGSYALVSHGASGKSVAGL